MRIYLDDAMCNLSANSVSQAIAGAAAVAREQGRAIVDVVIDGRRCAAEVLDQPPLSQSRPSEIHLTTVDRRELVRQAFNDASTALSEADRLQQAAAELLQADRAADAMRRLAEALDIWTNVRATVLMGAEMGGIDLSAEPHNSGAEGPQVHIAALALQLRALQDALAQRDTVALADTLLYDLPDVVAAWREMLCDLQQHVAK